MILDISVLKGRGVIIAHNKSIAKYLLPIGELGGIEFWAALASPREPSTGNGFPCPPGTECPPWLIQVNGDAALEGPAHG